MTPHALRFLGLGPDADERAIKRAYAARLKTTRPDEDPEGFQRLNEAYREAMAWHSAKQNAADPQTASDRAADHGQEVDGGEPHPGTPGTPDDLFDPAQAALPPATTFPLHPTTSDAPVNVGMLFHGLLEAAANASDEDFTAWLHGQPAFWSIADKAALGGRLLTLLRDEQPPIPAPRFECLVAFFAWSDLSAGHDALMLEQLRLALDTAWREASESVDDGTIAIPLHAGGWPCYGTDMTAQAGASNAAKRRERQWREWVRTWHPELLGRRSWPKLLLGVLLPSRTEAMRDFLATATASGTLHVFDPRAVRFWQGTAELSSPSRGSAMVVFTRSFAIGLAFALFVLTAAGAYARGQASMDMLIAGPIMAMAIAMLTAFGWLAMVLMVAFVRWQERPDPPPGWQRHLHRMAIPALVAAGAAIMSSPLPDGIALPLLLGAASTAWCRWTTRKPRASPFEDRDAHDARLVRQIVLAVLFVLLLGRIATSPDALAWSCYGLMFAATLFWVGDALRRPSSPRADTEAAP